MKLWKQKVTMECRQCRHSTLDTQPEKPSEEELTAQNEKSGCDKKEGDDPEEMMLSTFHIKEKHRYFMTLKGQRKNIGSQYQIRKEYGNLPRHKDTHFTS